MSLLLTSIDLKKAFDTVETEAVIAALGNRGVPTQYIAMLRELYDNFTIRISTFYKDVIINVRRWVRQDDTILPKLFRAALENIMRHLEWKGLGVMVDGYYLHRLRFADGIVPTTPNIDQAERMLADFESACRKVGLRLNSIEATFMKALKSIRDSSEEDYPDSSPFRHCCPSHFDKRLGDLDSTKAG